MARINLEKIFTQLSYEIKRALINSVRKQIPETELDSQKLYKDFVDAVGKECKKWEEIPNEAVEKGDF